MNLSNLFKKPPKETFDWTTIEIKGLQYDNDRLKAAKKLKFNEPLKLAIDNDNSSYVK